MEEGVPNQHEVVFMSSQLFEPGSRVIYDCSGKENASVLDRWQQISPFHDAFSPQVPSDH